MSRTTTSRRVVPGQRQAPDAVAAWAAAHPEVPLVRQPDGPEVAQAGLAAGTVYLVRPDGYVAEVR